MKNKVTNSGNREKRNLLWVWRCVDPRIPESQDESWAYEMFGSQYSNVSVSAVSIPGPERILCDELKDFQPSSQKVENRAQHLLGPMSMFNTTLVLIAHEDCKGFAVRCGVHEDIVRVAIDLWKAKLNLPAFGAIRRLDRNGNYGPPELIEGIISR